MTGRLAPIALLLLAATATGWAYAPALQAGFYFDDRQNIVEEPALHWDEISLERLRETATSAHLPRRWLANATFGLNHRFGGLEPRGYHLVNVLIHLAVGGVLAWVCWLYARRASPPEGTHRTAALAAAAATSLFLLHTLNTQAVTYVVQRMSSLAALFGLLAFGLYLVARGSGGSPPRPALAALALISWLLALGSKENSLILPAMVLAYEASFHRASWRRPAGAASAPRRAWLTLGLAAGLAVLALLVVHLYVGLPRLYLTENLPARDFTGLERVLTQSRIQLFYLALLLWPAPSRLNLDHGFAVSHSLFDPPSTALAVAFWLAVTVIAIRLARTRPRYGFPILAYLLLHAIESAPISLELVFEHRMYFPMAALAMLLTVLAADAPAARRRFLVAACLVAALPLGVATYQRNLTWADVLVFHRDCARKSPDKYRPHYNLGTELGMRGFYFEALGPLKRAVELRPDSSEAHNQLGTTYLHINLVSRALPEFVQAVQLGPGNAQAHFNLALTLDRTGRSPEAAPYYRRFLELVGPGEDATHAMARERLRAIADGLPNVEGSAGGRTN